jgi:hypothetical protein
MSLAESFLIVLSFIIRQEATGRTWTPLSAFIMEWPFRISLKAFDEI